jgi:DNA-binding CsgD family transcriptional regulator
VQTLLADERVWTGAESGIAARALSVTPREREVIRGLVCYRRLARVAEVLGISIHTARNHLKSVLRKLDLHSQDELLQFLLEGEHHA